MLTEVAKTDMNHVEQHSGPDDIGFQAVGPVITCTILATAVVALRWYTRCRIVRCSGLDDVVILASLTLSWSMCGIIIAAKGEGLGVRNGLIDATHLAKLLTANNVVWVCTVNITKASILLQYLRIFSCRTTVTICYIILLTLVPATLYAVLGGTLLCRPVAKLWNPTIPGHCLSAQKYWISVAAINIGLDFFTLLLPLPAITRLCLPAKEKLWLVLVFALGFFVCVVSTLRLTLVTVTANEGHLIKSTIWVIIWSSVEANVGIICASLLALKPLLHKTFPRLMDEDSLPRHHTHLPVIPDLPDTESGRQSNSTNKSLSLEGALKRTDTPMTPARLSQRQSLREAVHLEHVRWPPMTRY